MVDFGVHAFLYVIPCVLKNCYNVLCAKALFLKDEGYRMDMRRIEDNGGRCTYGFTFIHILT